MELYQRVLKFAENLQFWRAFDLLRSAAVRNGEGRASGAKRDAHLERERVQRERFRELYNQGERSGAVLAAWDAEPVDDPRYDTSWVRPPSAKDGDDRASAPAHTGTLYSRTREVMKVYGEGV